MVSKNNGASGQRSARTGLDTRWPRVAMAIAGTWSLLYLALGIAWLMGGPGNPADPAVDEGATLSLLGSLGPVAGAVTVTMLAALGVLLAGAMRVLPSATGRFGFVHWLVSVLAGSLGVILAVVLPDYRLLAALAYTPLLLVLKVFGTAPEEASLWEWPVVNMAVLTLAGLCWIAAAETHYRKTAKVGTEAGRGRAWTTSAAAARWGRWATAVAVAVPLGYAVTRFAWALGIPLGVDQQLLDDLGNRVYLGAGLATLGVAGAILTLGLVYQWGEVFPRWMLGIRGRRVPISLAVVPAAIVSVAVTSAGLMFVRFGVTRSFGDTFPGENDDVAAWLPEMFWPVWGIALAAATYAYWLRRRGSDPPAVSSRGVPGGISPGVGTRGSEL